jgi:uncharacterized protein DUF4407
LDRTFQANKPVIHDYNEKINAILSNSSLYISDSTGAPTDKLHPEFKKQIDDLKYHRNLLAQENYSKEKVVDDLNSEIKKARDDYQAIIAERIKDKQADISSTRVVKDHADSIAAVQTKEGLDVKERSYTNNFITQVEALGHLNSERFSTMWWTSILIMFLFIVIETAPIIVKLLTKRGSYDETLDRVEYEHYLNEQKIISDRNDEINNLLAEIKSLNKLKGEVRLKVEKAKLDAELTANESMLNDIAQKQAYLAQIAIDKWYKAELAKLNGNP